ncbi:MAG: hypothetical protein M3373_06650 [Gemmatimonadota bacterium]|nr:hypothetical protein [Gemmatimonadota bacterium]
MTARQAALVIALCTAWAWVPATAQRRPPARFFITSVGDSTIVFPIGAHDWVRPGRTGQAVDPTRHDTLVARFRVMEVRGGAATALITAQTTDVRPRHVAVIEVPATPWYRRRGFWFALLAGAGLGAAAAEVAR